LNPNVSTSRFNTKFFNEMYNNLWTDWIRDNKYVSRTKPLQVYLVGWFEFNRNHKKFKPNNSNCVERSGWLVPENPFSYVCFEWDMSGCSRVKLNLPSESILIWSLNLKLLPLQMIFILKAIVQPTLCKCIKTSIILHSTHS